MRSNYFINGNRMLVMVNLENEVADSFIYNMVVYNKIKGIAPVSWFQEDAERGFSHDITSCISLYDYVSAGLTKEKSLKLLKEMGETIREMEAYMMDTDSIIYGYNYMYINENDELICLTNATRNDSERSLDGYQLENMQSFIYGLVEYLNSNTGCEADWLKEVKEYIYYAKDEFDIQEFIKRVNYIENKRFARLAATNVTVPDKQMDEAFENDMKKVAGGYVAMPAKTAAKMNSKKENKFINKKEKNEKKSLFGMKKDSVKASKKEKQAEKQKAIQKFNHNEKTPMRDFAIPGQKNCVIKVPVVKDEFNNTLQADNVVSIYGKVDPSIEESYARARYKKNPNDNYGGTSVLCS